MGPQLRELINTIRDAASELPADGVARRGHPARDAAQIVASALGRLETLTFEVETGVYDRILATEPAV